MSSRVLRFRITEADYHRIRQAAQSDRTSISTLVRYAVAEWIACGEDADAATTACSSLCPRCPTASLRVP